MEVGHKDGNEYLAQLVAPSDDLPKDMDFLIELGFKLINIFPDDSPEVAIMTGHGISIRLDKKCTAQSSTISLLTDDTALLASKKKLLAPNGCIFKFIPKSYHLTSPPTQHAFEIRQLLDKEPWVIGRAGMHYRDLVPSRLGGGIMASHIRIPNGGPVPDMVHFHTIGFQLIFCYKGWVKLVYEDQGPPFILKAGDCVTQPPEIRHRVLEASDNLEVIEIGVPAEHMTSIDHEMVLPNAQFNPDREFDGQRFVRHIANDATWLDWRLAGFKSRDTGVNNASKQVATVNVVRPNNCTNSNQYYSHDADIHFTFILQGSMLLDAKENNNCKVNSGDAFVIPPKMQYTFKDCSDDLEFLEVALRGNFNTQQH